jgi:Lon protease-like protein
MQDTHLIRIPLFPLHQGLFPDGILQLSIFEVRYLDLMRQCEASKTPFGIVFIAEGSEIETPAPSQHSAITERWPIFRRLPKPSPIFSKSHAKVEHGF